MTNIRKAFIAALRSLMSGKSFIQAFLDFWVRPSDPGKKKNKAKGDQPPSTDTNGSLLTSPTSASDSATSSTWKPPAAAPDATSRTIDDFLREAEDLLLKPVQGDRLRALARQLQDQFRSSLLSRPICMLPSYNHKLPNGQERGQFLSLDVGGSTLRVALIELRGRRRQPLKKQPEPEEAAMSIVRIQSFKITPQVKALEGMDFFDWMAARIMETLAHGEGADTYNPDRPLQAGLAWSFPIEQTSLRGGLLLDMGKGFRAADLLLGQDLGDIIQKACEARGLHVELAAIVNDSTAALLSESYEHAATRFGLILGTGVNIAVYLPVTVVGRSKFGDRPAAWFEEASHVIVNTELGMFGHDILPISRWDALLNADHPKPEFQPLEHLVSGYYLGEVCRFALLEAVNTAGLFGGVMPPSLLEPYALDTETLSRMEADHSASLETASAAFQACHPSALKPTYADIAVVRTLASLISRRSSAIVAASVYGLWALKGEAEGEYLHTLAEGDVDADAAVLVPAAQETRSRFADAARAELSIVRERTVVAFNGSVIERYPGYLALCRDILQTLLREGPSVEGTETIDLVPAEESSLLGAAVSLACLAR